jgi:hypothetical protein
MSRLAAEVLRSDTRIGENQADQHARRSVE